MTFLEHLDELRKRLFRCAIVYVAVLSGCWYFSPRIVEFLLRPIKKHLFAGGDIVFLRLTEPFMVYMKASAVAALFISAPFLLHQLWGFVAPGLYRRERITGVAFLTFGSLFLVVGGAFGYYVATPIAAKWLIQLGSGFRAALTLESAFEFEAWVLLGMGLVFELPHRSVLPGPDRPRHAEVPARPPPPGDHRLLRLLGDHHADGRHAHDERLRAADGRTVPPRHPHHLADGTAEEGLEEPVRVIAWVARMGLAGKGEERGGRRCSPIDDDEGRSICPQPPCALRVRGGAGASAASPLLVDGGTSTTSRLLASAPAAPRTRPTG